MQVKEWKKKKLSNLMDKKEQALSLFFEIFMITN